MDVDGGPVRWDPCQAITYSTNLAAGPGFAASELAAALDQVRSSTGLRFAHVGETTATRRRDAPGRVLMAMLDEDEFPFGDPSASGYGQAFPQQRSDGRDWYRSGVVVIRPDHDWTAGLDSRNPLVTMFMHELGHLVGLAHVSSLDEIMGPGGNGAVRAWGPGDREGLRRLGQGGCAPS